MKLLLLLTLVLVGCSSGPTVTPIDPDGVVKPKFERICIIGDGGIGDNNQIHVANALATEGCTRVLYVGDVIYENGITKPDDGEFFKKFYFPYKTMLEKQNVPFYMSMGNHDWYPMGSGKHWLEISKKHKNIEYPGYFYAKQFKDFCLVQFEVYKTRMWEKGINFADGLDETSFYRDCKFVIGFSHYPFFSSVGKHGDATKSQQDYMIAMGVGTRFDVYVGGHDHHLSDEGELGKTRLFISGSAGKLRKLKGTSHYWAASKYGYLVIELRSDTDRRFYFVGVKGKEKKKIYEGSF